MSSGLEYRSFNIANTAENAGGTAQVQTELHGAKQDTPNKQFHNVLRPIMKGTIAVLVLVLIAEIIFHFFVAPYISLERVIVEGDSGLSTEAAIEMGNIPLGELFYRINEDDIRENFLSQLHIRSAHVRRVFPNILRVNLESRKALGIVMVNYDNVVLPALIDHEGIVYKIGYEIENWNLPIIQGIEFDSFKAGARVSDSYTVMLDDIRYLKNEGSAILRAFSEFKIDEVYSGVYEWLLVPIHIPVQIRTSPGLDYEQGRYILKIVEFLRGQENINDIVEIDFRAGDVVYNRRDSPLQDL